MRSVFERVVFYCETNHKILLHPDKRAEIKRLVEQKWYETMTGPLPKTIRNVLEPEGMTYCQINYPEHFVPRIDEVVENFFAQSRRTRIPLDNKYLKVEYPAIGKKIS